MFLLAEQTKEEKTNLDRVIGATGVVTEEIKKNHIGEVRVIKRKNYN